MPSSLQPPTAAIDFNNPFADDEACITAKPIYRYDSAVPPRLPPLVIPQMADSSERSPTGGSRPAERRTLLPPEHPDHLRTEAARIYDLDAGEDCMHPMVQTIEVIEEGSDADVEKGVMMMMERKESWVARTARRMSEGWLGKAMLYPVKRLSKVWGRKGSEDDDVLWESDEVKEWDDTMLEYSVALRRC
ncbi:hypothetical protein NA57DRAFT_75100 [Rhizodiscina lignyota]|uniref:Uncharacterized protein n=1 Tax=Rhizodiscina lignyota TaxID=1504668 RepID=A0A9P4IHX5_9PEZI|nr:hypothetical protein NA57DRAFT_75100 [Rhizodiscina lignyota]